MDSLILQIFNIVTGVAMLLLFLRFMMQLTQVDPYNPIVMSTVKATHIVDVFKRILPTVGHGRINLAALGLIILVRLVDLSGNLLLNDVTNIGPDRLAVELVFGLLGGFLQMCIYMIWASVIASIVMMLTQNPTPLVMLVMQMTEPLYAPFRKVLPDLGPFDLSPMVAWLVISILLKLLTKSHYFVLQGLA